MSRGPFPGRCRALAWSTSGATETTCRYRPRSDHSRNSSFSTSLQARLDASVQAQILRLLLELQKEYSLSYMLITHNIAVSEYLSDFMLVMYSGDVVEYGQTEEIMAKPRASIHDRSNFLSANRQPLEEESAPSRHSWRSP